MPLAFMQEDFLVEIEIYERITVKIKLFPNINFSEAKRAKPENNRVLKK